MTVIWRPCPDFEDAYEISNYGDVKRILGGPGRVVGRVLRPKTDKDGYLSVTLVHNKRVKYARVHRLVCEAFHGGSPVDKPWALHRDGNNQNNHESNLYWGDAVENQHDAIRHGTHFGSVKTACLRGHPYTPENTYLDSRGKRSCKECRLAAGRAYYHRKKRGGNEL